MDHYLANYVIQGGSAVRVLCGDAGNRSLASDSLITAARKLGYVTALIDAESVRVHLVHDLFHAVASKIDWFQVADQFSRKLLARMEFDVPDERALNGEAIAKANGVSRAQFNKRRDSTLRELVLRNPNYTRQFKSVILSLVGATFESAGYEHAVGLRVIEWLRGQPSDKRILLQANLSRRINRQTGRAMLVDVARWVRSAGLPGLCIVVDASNYSIQRASGSTGRSYSATAALDLFEMIRQFIDSSDDAVGLFLCFTTAPEFLVNSKRGLSAYPALKMRLLDDVYDSKRPNLLAPVLMLDQ